MGRKIRLYFNPLAFYRKTTTAKYILCSLAKSLVYNLRGEKKNLYFLNIRPNLTQGSAESPVKITAFLHLLRSLSDKCCLHKALRQK